MRVFSCIAFGTALAGAFAPVVRAQSPNQLGAWAALMVSPFGALPPRVTNTDPDTPHQTEFSLSYGRWKYDKDDAAHNNVGLTVARQLSFANSEVALTGAYLSLQCGGCANWVMAGAEFQSTLWRRALGRSSARPAIGTFGLRSNLGGGRNMGQEKSRTISFIVVAPVGIGLALGRHSYLDIAVSPGFGYGRITGVDRSEAGTRPSIGSAAAWRSRSGLGVEVGIQKVFVNRGPSQLGVGLSWGLGKAGRTPS